MKHWRLLGSVDEIIKALQDITLTAVIVAQGHTQGSEATFISFHGV